MAYVGESIVYAEPEYTDQDERVSSLRYIAHSKPASGDAFKAIIEADPSLERGMTRSEWLWIRLANGDLIFGVFPQDDLYFTFEQEHS